MEGDDTENGEAAYAIEGRESGRDAKVLREHHGDAALPGHGRSHPRGPRILLLTAILLLVASIATVAGQAHGEAKASATIIGPCLRSPAAGRYQRTVSVDGEQRRYLIGVPGGWGRHPVILGFHGYGNNAEWFANDTGLIEEGTARGAIVVLPWAVGDPARWALPGRLAGADDLAFVDALLRDVSSFACADQRRVFAAGFSNGAAFTGLLACVEASRFAGVALVAGAGLASPCPGGPRIGATLVQTLDDPTVRYRGGPVIGIHAVPFRSAAREWKRRDGPTVAIFVLPNGGHSWIRTPSFDTTRVVLDRFLGPRRA